MIAGLLIVFVIAFKLNFFRSSDAPAVISDNTNTQNIVDKQDNAIISSNNSENINITLPNKINKKPNIVFINIDTLRADHMGIYGYSKNTTPFMDSLFKKGVVFENVTAPGFITPQTDAAIFSGLYPSQNNVRGWNDQINEKLNLLPKILGLYGYKTGAFVCFGLQKSFGLDKQFDFYDYSMTELKNAASSREKVVNWMTENKKPFFVFWHIYDVHFPYTKPTVEFYNKNYNGIFSNKDNFFNTVNQTTEGMTAMTGPEKDVFKKITPEDIEYSKASYDSGVKYVDEQIRTFFDQIKNKDFYNNTIFIISSEHGEDLKEHGFIFHKDLYDVTTRVPLAIISPALKAGRMKEPVSSVDIMPTIVDMIGETVPQNISGISLLPTINGKSTQRDIFSERAPFDEFSIRRGNWKYILRNPNKKDLSLPENSKLDAFMKMMIVNDVDSGDELYNLAEDPDEQKNLVGSGLPIEDDLKKAVLEFKKKMQKAREYNANIGKTANMAIPYP